MVMKLYLYPMLAYPLAVIKCQCRPRVNGLARVDERGVCFVVVPIKYSVGVRHALIAPQSYDVRVHVYTYSKVVTLT